MPSVSDSQHRFIGWLHSNPAARKASGMSKAKVDEWLHADRGSPWKHRADGGYTADRPQISREDDAEVLSYGRPQGRDVDINLTPPPMRGAPASAITSPHLSTTSNLMKGSVVPPWPAHQYHFASGGFAHRQDGGASPLPTQSAGMMAPMAQQQLSTYASMPLEQLTELALRLRGSPQGQLAQRVLQQRRMSPQASPDAGSGPPQAYAFGGSLDEKGGAHFREGAISSPGGFLHTAGPGRTDNLSIKPHADSYVVPADVVSGWGQGNSLAGAKAFQMAINSGPMGTSLGHVGHRMGPPQPPGVGHIGGFPHAKGGKTEAPKVPVLAAGGEIVVTPEEVTRIGHGDIKRGHKILDELVLHSRTQTIKDLKGLKPPVGASRKR